MTAKLRIRKTKRYDDEVIYSAKFLYLKKWTPNEIAKELGLNSARPIYYWAEKYNWRNLINENGIEELIALRIITLTERENKTDQEIKELEALIDKDIEYKKQRAKKAQSAQKVRLLYQKVLAILRILVTATKASKRKAKSGLKMTSRMLHRKWCNRLLIACLTIKSTVARINIIACGIFLNRDKLARRIISPLKH